MHVQAAKAAAKRARMVNRGRRKAQVEVPLF
jgi:hypothetical protein